MTAQVQRARPGPRKADGVLDSESPRRSGYGEDYVISLDPRVYADEGSYRVLRNATPGTGVAGHAAPTTHDTQKAYIMLRNGEEAVADALRFYLDYIKLVVTAAGTNGTLNYATHTIDNGRGYTSGGADLIEVDPNMASNAKSILNLAKVGAVVPSEANTDAARIVAHQALRTVIPVVGDEILFKFGTEVGSGAAVPLEGVLQLSRVIHCPPIVLGPGNSYHLVLWRASQSGAASYEVEIGGWTR